MDHNSAIYPGPTEDTRFLAINQTTDLRKNVPRLALVSASSAGELSRFSWKTTPHGHVYRQWIAADGGRVTISMGAEALRIGHTLEAQCFPMNGDRLDCRLDNLVRARLTAYVTSGSTFDRSTEYAEALRQRIQDAPQLRVIYRHGRKVTKFTDDQVRCILEEVAKNEDDWFTGKPVSSVRDFIVGNYMIPFSLQQTHLLIRGKQQYQPDMKEQYQKIAELFPTRKAKRFARLGLN